MRIKKQFLLINLGKKYDLKLFFYVKSDLPHINEQQSQFYLSKSHFSEEYTHWKIVYPNGGCAPSCLEEAVCTIL